LANGASILVNAGFLDSVKEWKLSWLSLTEHWPHQLVP
jgi:hypothetical protein